MELKKAKFYFMGKKYGPESVTSNVYFPTIDVDLKNISFLAGKKVGDDVILKVKAKVKSKTISNSINNNDYDNRKDMVLEIREIGKLGKK